MSERRAEPRHSVNRAFGSAADFANDYISDLSRTGVFIKSDDPLPIGTELTLRFTVLVDDEIERIEGVGEVVRVVLPGTAEPPGMGVAFRELSSSSRAIIDRILEKRR